ncbi:MAG: hypothetical protein KGZ39_03775 [Simkania sp.]|nr:hypothetical protein [Simkania sp.]
MSAPRRVPGEGFEYSIRPKVTVEREVTINGRQYIVSIKALTKGAAEDLAVNGDARHLGQHLEDVIGKMQRPVQEQFNAMKGHTDPKKSDEFRLRFTKDHEFQNLTIDLKSPGAPSRPLVYQKIEQVFDRHAYDKSDMENSELGQAFSALEQAATQAVTPMEEELLSPRSRPTKTPLVNIDQESLATYGESIGWAAPSKSGNSPDLLGALATEMQRAFPTEHTEKNPITSKRLRSELTDALNILANELNPDDDDSIDESSKRSPDSTQEVLNAVKANFDILDPKTSATLQRILANHQKETFDTVDNLEELLAADPSDLSEKEQSLLLKIYAEYLTKGGNGLNPITVGSLMHELLGVTIAFFSEKRALAFTDEKAINPQTTPLLHVTTDKKGLLTEVRAPTPNGIPLPAKTSPSALIGVEIDDDDINDCGGAGNCGPNSLVDQLQQLGVTDTSGEDPLVGEDPDVKRITSDMRTHYADGLEKLANKLDKNTTLPEGEQHFLGLVITDINERSGNRVKNTNADQAKALRAYAEKFKKPGKKSVESVSSSFFHYTARNLRISCSEEHLNIAIVRPTQDGSYAITEVFPNDVELKKENTLFVVYNARAGALTGDHFLSLNRENDEILTQLLHQREKQQLLDFLNLVSSTPKPPLSKIASSLKQLEDQTPNAYAAIEQIPGLKKSIDDSTADALLRASTTILGKLKNTALQKLSEIHKAMEVDMTSEEEEEDDDDMSGSNVTVSTYSAPAHPTSSLAKGKGKPKTAPLRPASSKGPVEPSIRELSDSASSDGSNSDEGGSSEEDED